MVQQVSSQLYYITIGLHFYDFYIQYTDSIVDHLKLCSFRKEILNQTFLLTYFREILVTKLFRKANSTNSHHQRSSVHQYQVSIQVFTSQYHFVEKIFMFAFVAKLHTERQFDQYLLKVGYIDTWKQQEYMRTYTQHSLTLTQPFHVPIFKLIFSAGIYLQVQFQNISNIEWKVGEIN